MLSELRAGAVDLDDLADLGDVDELVDQALAVHLGQNASLIIVPEGEMLGFSYTLIPISPKINLVFFATKASMIATHLNALPIVS